MTRGAGKRCFNGTLGYTPAFGALVLVGGCCWCRAIARRGICSPRPFFSSPP